MRILGLDIGTKRIGVALSDALGITAQGVFTIEIVNLNDTLDRIKELVSNRDTGAIVVGLPLNMDGSQGPQAKRAIEFADSLKKVLDIPIKLWDERMSTMQVERVMIEAGTSRAKRKKKIDKLAAQVILQSYLDAHG